MDDILGNGTSLPPVPFIPSDNNDTSEDPGLATAIRTAIDTVQLALGLPVNVYALQLMLSGTAPIASEFFHLNLMASVLVTSLAIAVFDLAGNFAAGVFHRARFFAVVLYLFSVPLFQCCRCVERYVAVTHPVAFLRFRPLRYRAACGAAVWLAAVALSVGCLFNGWSPATCFIFAGFAAACISAMSFCCLSVLWALKRPGPGEGREKDGGGAGGDGNDVKRRAFRIILVSLVVMLLTTMSYIPLSLAIALSPPLRKSTAAMAANYAIVHMSGFVHPLLHVHRAGKLGKPCFNRL